MLPFYVCLVVLVTAITRPTNQEEELGWAHIGSAGYDNLTDPQIGSKRDPTRLDSATLDAEDCFENC